MTTDKNPPPVATVSADQPSLAARVPFSLALAADTAEEEMVCPNCRRGDALAVVGEMLFCMACGYTSEGGRGCT